MGWWSTPTDQEVFEYGRNLGQVLQTAASSAAAVKTIAKSMPKVARILEGAGNAAEGTINATKGAAKVDDFINNNIPKQFQTQVRNAFGSDVKVTTLTKDTTVYRYYGGDSAPSIYWVTPTKSSNPISELALPPGNTAQYVDSIILKKGTTILEGTVAPNFGQPGGGYQYYVPGLK